MNEQSPKSPDLFDEQAAQVLETLDKIAGKETPEIPPVSIRALYEKYNQNPEVQELDRLQQEYEAWVADPTHGGGNIMDRYEKAKQAVQPLREPIDEQNQKRFPAAMGIDRTQLEEIVAKDSEVERLYRILNERLFDWERRVSPGGPEMRTAEEDFLSTLERFNNAVAGKIADYKAKDPSEVLTALRSELSPAAAAAEPVEEAEPAEPAAPEPAKPESTEARETPKTPIYQVRERLKEINRAAEQGKSKTKMTDYLEDFLQYHLYMQKGGTDEAAEQARRQIRDWSPARCWDEAAKILGTERKKVSRKEPKAMIELRERMAQMEERLSKLEEETAVLREENQRMRDLLKRFHSGELDADGLKEEIEKIGIGAEETEEAPAPAEEEAVEEAAEEEEAEMAPESTAVDNALNELLERYAPQEKIEKGRVRGALLPILGAVGGGRVAEIAATALERLGRVPVPGFAALSTGLSSLGASAIRRLVGENSFSLYSRYSHTEGGKGRFLGKVVKIGQMLGRGAERWALRRILGLTGSQEVRQLLEFYNNQENRFLIPEGLELTQTDVERLIKGGMWYQLGIEAAERLGAYFTAEEKNEISANQPRILEAIRELYNSDLIPAEQREEVLQRIQDDLIRREKGIYTAEAGVLAGIGAGKAALLSGVGSFVADRLVPRVAEYVSPPPAVGVGKEPIKAVKEPVKEIVKAPEKVQELIVHKTVGHTYVANARPTVWTDLGKWAGRLAANDTENPELWGNAAKMVNAIIGNPDKALAGLEPGTYNAALKAARATKKALETAGYNPTTNTLTNPEAVMGDLESIKSLFHWVREGQKIFEPA